MPRTNDFPRLVLATALLSGTACVAAQFETGSNGGFGALNVTEDIALPVPPDGVFHFTTVNVANSAVVTFVPNARNTPVRMLATGDVVISGALVLSGEGGAYLPQGGFAQGGRAGPGGFPGADTVPVDVNRSANGYGPGGGRGILDCPGLGGGHATAAPDDSDVSCPTGLGQPYGQARLGSLLGGSGGAGSVTYLGAVRRQASGGGGGGAILIASPTRIELGVVRVDGGDGGGSNAVIEAFSSAGGGSGGSIHLSAPEVQLPASRFNPSVTARGGAAGEIRFGGGRVKGGSGADGRIVIAANAVSGNLDSAQPRPILVRPREALATPSEPLLRIASVDGFTAPLEPTGSNDILIPAESPTTITVEFVSTSVPLGQRVTLTAVPAIGDPITVLSSPIEGTLENGTAQASIDVPVGTSTLTASLSYSQP